MRFSVIDLCPLLLTIHDAKLLKILAVEKKFLNDNDMNLAIAKQIEAGDIYLS